MTEGLAHSEQDTLSFAAGKWGPCPRLSRLIPYGYMVDPANERMLLPVVHELEALEQAKAHLKKGYGLRTVAQWLEGTTGRHISHEGLKRRVQTDLANVRRATTLRTWAERLVRSAQEVRTFDIKVGNDTGWYDEFVAGILESLKGASEKADRGDAHKIFGGVSAKPRSTD